jgi:putative endonuclease
LKNLLNRLFGNQGERAAVRFLKQQKLRILATQMRNTFGEIDIIADDSGVVVFVEVKTRRSSESGQPFEAVNQAKRQKLTRTALAWLKRQGRLESPARFDIVSIVWPDDGSAPQIDHYRNAFEPTGRGQMFG